MNVYSRFEKLMSAIIFKSNWGDHTGADHLIWYNSSEKAKQVPSEMRPYLQEIAKRRDMGMVFGA
jgi:hypothetical protein